MPLSSRKKLLLVIIFLVAAALLVPPFINANRFRARIASSIGDALDRKVSIGNVSVVLLPQPGFELSDFVIQDDPAYNAEPLLQSSSVDAYLRLSSLWRGRLEIARLTLDSPSLNLARNLNGEWNLQSILQHASQVPAAPTGLKTPVERPRFPYIEAKNGRVNFKYLNEKTAFALGDADFAFWQESEGQWRMRLAARPLRTDANLGNAGTLRISASFVKTEDLADVPIRADITLEKIQLGQFTSLITGHDSGWRGDLRITATVTGTSHRLNLESKAHISDFRRYDIATSGALDLDAGCRAEWTQSSSVFPQAGPALENLQCQLPPDAPTVVVSGDVLFRPQREYRIQVKADQVPASFLAQLARRVKRGLPDDLDASGALSGDFNFGRPSSPPKAPVDAPVTGSAGFTDLVLRSPSLGSQVVVGTLRMGFPSPVRSKHIKKPDQQQFVIEPFSLKVNDAAPLEAAGTLTAKQYLLQVKGVTELQAVLAASRLFGLERARIHATGNTRLDLAISGEWTGFAPPVVTGTASLQQVTAQLPDISFPLHLDSALLELTPDFFILRNISGKVGAPVVIADGRVAVPRNCTDANCPAQFDLHFPVLDVDDLNRVLNPRFRTTSWFNLERFFGGPEEVTPLLRDSKAVGVVAVDRLRLKKLIATNVSAVLSLDSGQLRATQVNATVLGGRHTGTWRADLKSDPPSYIGQGKFDSVDVGQTSTLLAQPLGTGRASGNYELQLRGNEWGDLLHSLQGAISYRWENGSILPSAKAIANHPLRFSHWTGMAEINGIEIRLLQGSMLAGKQSYRTEGTASLTGDLNLRFSTSGSTISLDGTLQEPIVAVTTGAASPESASNSRNATTAKASN